MPASGIPGVSLTSPSSISSDARQKAEIVASNGTYRITESDNNVDSLVDRAKLTRQKIRMKTQVSPDSIELPVEMQTPLMESAPAIEQTTEASDVTKPLSPQLVALAKQRRALQVKEREISEREKALESRSQDGTESLIAKIQADPLSVLRAHGAPNFYDQLTEAILADQSGHNPQLQQLEAKIKSLEEGINKNFSERDNQAEAQVLNEMSKEAHTLASTGEDFELIRANRQVPTVMELVKRTYKQTGEVLDVADAMKLVEDELLKDSLRLANLNKVKSRLIPNQQPPGQLATKQQGIRTLTNRDSASPELSRKQRAVMAMNGLLNRR